MKTLTISDTKKHITNTIKSIGNNINYLVFIAEDLDGPEYWKLADGGIGVEPCYMWEGLNTTNQRALFNKKDWWVSIENAIITALRAKHNVMVFKNFNEFVQWYNKQNLKK